MGTSFTIKQIFADHWSSFLSTNPNIRDVVITEVERMLGCGEPENGYAMYKCPTCGKYKFLPFRCHSRFCNTCGTAYQQNRSDSIAAKMINCRHRHIVFTIAEELRPYFRKDRTLLNVLFKTSAQVISDWSHSLNKKESFEHGMICGLHTFGRDLKWNPHIHMLVTEGASGNITNWKNVVFFPYTMLRKKWMTALLANLKTSLNPNLFSLAKFKRLTDYLYINCPDGFYVHAPSSDFNSPEAVAKYITRYIGRPAMAQSRIINYDGENVTFWYQRHEDNKPTVETVSAFEFIKKLIIHIPDKGFNMLRYYGLYAKPSKETVSLVRKFPSHVMAARKTMQRWAFRIELSFGKDPLKCSCGDYMEFVDTFFPIIPANSS